VSASRLALVPAALVVGLGAAWITPGRLLAPVALAAILATANGYSKAYSP
jgi:hypothetical protein